MSATPLMKRVAYGVAWRSGTLAALRWLHRDRIPILCYHSVIDQPGPPWLTAWDGGGGLHVPADQFRAQLEFLRRRYHVVPLEEVVNDLSAGRQPRPRSVVLTFDDGYANTLAVAAPLLAEFDVPATVFLATDYIGRNLFWWDELRARLWSQSGGPGSRAALARAQEQLRAATLQQRAQLLAAIGPDPGPVEGLRPAKWDECRRAPETIQFGGHGAAHRLLGEIAPEAAREDLDRCQHALREHLPGRTVGLFCYPAGQSTAAVRAALPRAGFRAAVIAGPERADQRLARPVDDLTLLPRVGVTSRMTLAAFAASIAGISTMLRW